SGLDIFSFSYVTMRYHLSEKVATSTSVIIMAINSVAGFILHYFIINDFGTQEFNYWLVSIPIVVIGAPLGAYFINNRTRVFISKFLYIVIIAQFIGALLIIRPTGKLLLFSILVFVFGILFFFGFAWLSKKVKFLR
ncbi:MAG: sulfite exporter TauE/SafE family protein, partial [Cyclobacteriaceae bacterium]|nr:sulfite exporter TauE/SafE family protein [Cyclobacteriaceae bacterium]